MSDFPRSLIAFQRRFADQASCVAYLVAQRWPEGFRCPACGHDRAWALKSKPRTFECTRCHRQTSVTAGTVMHGSKLGLLVWFLGAYLMATHSNGISARQLQAQLGLGSYKSAWLLCAKLRRAMVDPDRKLLTGLVEVDETTIPPIGPGTSPSPARRGAATAPRWRLSARSRPASTAPAASAWRRSPTIPPPACTASSPPR